MQNQYYEEEIDLLDFLYNVLLNLKRIIIVALVGALIGCGFAFYSNAKENKIVDALLSDTEKALVNYDDKISQSDLLAVNVYKNSSKEIDRLEDYLNYAPKLNNTVNDYVYVYTANLKVTNVTDINGIIGFINNKVFNDKTLNELIDKNNFRTDSKYYSDKYFLKELISLENISENEAINGDIIASRIKTLNLSVTASNEQIAAKLGEEMVNTILSCKDEITREFNAYVYLTSANTNSKYLSEINLEKIELQNKLSTLIKTNKDTLKGFSRIQLKYLASTNPELEIKVGRGLVKNTLIGLVAGGFLMCAYYGILYILAGKLHSAEEISNRSLKVYGTLVTKPCNNWLDKIFKKGNGESLNTIINKIKLDLANNEVKDLVISSTLSDISSLSELLEEIKKELSVKDVYLDVTNNEEFFKKCKEGASVIYIEKIDDSKTKDINKVIYTNKEFNINGLGAIVVD